MENVDQNPEAHDAYVTQLAKAAAAGNRSARAEFVRLTQGEVWQLAARLVGPSNADDLTQETYVRALSALCCVPKGSSARLWLLSLARDVCSGREPDLGEGELARLVAVLPQSLREAFVLTQVLQFSYAEASEITGCSIAATRARLAQARTLLVQELRPARQ